MGTSPLITAIFSALLYFSLGIWLGRMQPQSLWYAPFLMNIFIWVIFIPMGMEFWPPKIRIWYFLIPPLVALFTAYLGMYLGSFFKFAQLTSQNFDGYIGKRDLNYSPHRTRLVSYIILFFLGVVGMFICYLLVFLYSFFLSLSFGASYALSYLFVYPLLALGQSWRYHERWLRCGVVLCLAPLLYWFSLLWSDGKLSWSRMSFSNDTIMMAIMPLTLALSCITAFVAVRLKKFQTL